MAVNIADVHGNVLVPPTPTNESDLAASSSRNVVYSSTSASLQHQNSPVFDFRAGDPNNGGNVSESSVPVGSTFLDMEDMASILDSDVDDDYVDYETFPAHMHNSAVEYWDIGDAQHICGFCNALFWYEERVVSASSNRNAIYSLCCCKGNVVLPFMTEMPSFLHQLIHGSDERSKHFIENVRSYNSMFSFTSMGGKVVQNVNRGKSPPIFKLHGQNYHLIGSLLPPPGSKPKFAQLYIYDTENEIRNRVSSVSCSDDSGRTKLHEGIVIGLTRMLNENNVLVKSFRLAKEKMDTDNAPNVRLRLIGKRSGDARTYNLPSVSEVAALVVGDFDESMGERDILVETQSGVLKRINELNPAYFALQYPLLFPYGEDGYRDDTPLSRGGNVIGAGRNRVSIREFLAFRIQERCDNHSSMLRMKRLFQQFIVDGYTLVEAARLRFVRTHQIELRCEMYKGLSDAFLRGESDSRTQGKRIVLPPTFTGGARFMIQNYQDAMAICRWAGYPDLFITFTCNPRWPEIDRFLHPRNLKAEDRPDIVSRIFKVKLDGLIRDLRKNRAFGNVRGVVYTIEFQKRGLPHAHILLWLANNDKLPSPTDIDRVISAEIPDINADPLYYAAVKNFMMHGPCGNVAKSAPCMVDGKCTKHFPKKWCEETTVDNDGYPIYRRRCDERRITKNKVDLDNRFVVPHSRYLLMKYGAHMNVEWCNQSRSIKYLFKYINKGRDRVTAGFYQTTDVEAGQKPVDEIQMYYDCRYISSCEAAWRIFGFEIQYKTPHVERLSFHLPGEQSVVFRDDEPLDSVVRACSVKESMFTAWMEANKKYPEARLLTYAEFPQKFVWKTKTREWSPRKQNFAIGRVYHVHPGSGESYYLRCLLNHVRGATSHQDLRTLNGVIYVSFRDACYALGLLDDDKEFIDAFIEASHFSSAFYLRILFVILLWTESMARPEYVWEKCWSFMADDIQYMRRRILQHPDLILSDDQLVRFALEEIERLLQTRGKSLRDYPPMPTVVLDSLLSSNDRLIFEELRYDQSAMIAEHSTLFNSLTDEQLQVYDTIMRSVDEEVGGIYFVYGYGGSGKTFVWKTLSAAIRSKGEIVLNVASSGIASLLLPGGRTAHSRFAIPISLNEDSTCHIKQGSPLAKLIVRCKLIIWDEAPMLHRFCFEALDRSMRDIMRFHKPNCGTLPYGGKTMVFGGDFRQVLPVIPRGSRQDVVNATINSSYLWSECTVLRLTKNMRLQNLTNPSDSYDLKLFSDWIASVGDGVAGDLNDGHVLIPIPDDILIHTDGDPIAAIVESIFPEYVRSAADVSCLRDRAILAPTLAVVEAVNEYMMALNVGEVSRTYLSSDTVSKLDSTTDLMAELHTPEFLNSIKLSGVPNHELTLKVGTPVMLLRNIDHSMGLCNGTRLILTRLADHVLEGKILTGVSAGQKVLIPRLSLTPSDTSLPFKFQRRQYPVMTSYAMTINKSQGQSLSRVGLLLQKPVFTHGQLYVAISRVTNRCGLKILIVGDDGRTTNKTQNVVFKEVFNNV